MALSVSVLTGLTVIEKEVSLIAKAISPWRHSGEDAVNKLYLAIRFHLRSQKLELHLFMSSNCSCLDLWGGQNII